MTIKANQLVKNVHIVHPFLTNDKGKAIALRIGSVKIENGKVIIYDDLTRIKIYDEQEKVDLWTVHTLHENGSIVGKFQWIENNKAVCFWDMETRELNPKASLGSVSQSYFL